MSWLACRASDDLQTDCGLVVPVSCLGNLLWAAAGWKQLSNNFLCVCLLVCFYLCFVLALLGFQLLVGLSLLLVGLYFFLSFVLALLGTQLFLLLLVSVVLLLVVCLFVGRVGFFALSPVGCGWALVSFHCQSSWTASGQWASAYLTLLKVALVVGCFHTLLLCAHTCACRFWESLRVTLRRDPLLSV